MLDAASLEVLVMSASTWLEVASLRKQAQAQREAGEAVSGGRAGANGYFFPRPICRACTKARGQISPNRSPSLRSSRWLLRRRQVQPRLRQTDPFAGLSAEDADIHRKAQRFARLLVDEIKLYNQAKVSEGRRNKDLYDRLKEDIEKSRVTFQKRYGNTAAASGDYFQKEVLRSLAEDDLSVMGANFRSKHQV